MKHLYLSLVAVGAGLLVGCQSARPTVPIAAQPVPAKPLPQPDGGVHRIVEFSRPLPTTVSRTGYDDSLIARIHRGETDESQLLKWFGAPESRSVQPDGRSHLTWSFRGNPQAQSPVAGTLDVNLTRDGKVEAYSAGRTPPANWQALSAVPVVYDDQQIAKIKRGQTTAAVLVGWFGPPDRRNAASNGREDLSWSFAPASAGDGAHPGGLYVSLAPDGSVDAYSARHGSP